MFIPKTKFALPPIKKRVELSPQLGLEFSVMTLGGVLLYILGCLGYVKVERHFKEKTRLSELLMNQKVE